MSSTDELKSSLKITRVRLKLFKPLISFVKRCNKTRGHLIFLHFKLEKPTECHSFMSRDRSQIIEKSLVKIRDPRTETDSPGPKIDSEYDMKSDRVKIWLSSTC